jgi:hypothetical protein
MFDYRCSPKGREPAQVRTMSDDKRMEIIENLLWGDIPEGELFELARRQLGFRVYSEEAFELLGHARGLVAAEPDGRPSVCAPQSANIH